MVSAVFHNPLEARDAARAESRDSTVKPTAAPEANASHPSPTMTSTAAPTPVAPRAPIDWGGWALAILAPVAGLALLIGIWALLTAKSTTFPTPAATWSIPACW